MDFIDVLEKYRNHFGDNFPTIPLLDEMTEQEAAELIDICIRENKTVYQLKITQEDENILY